MPAAAPGLSADEFVVKAGGVEEREEEDVVVELVKAVKIIDSVEAVEEVKTLEEVEAVEAIEVCHLLVLAGQHGTEKVSFNAHTGVAKTIANANKCRVGSSDTTPTSSVLATKSVRVTLRSPDVVYCEIQRNKDPWGSVIGVPTQLKLYTLGEVSNILISSECRFIWGSDMGQQVTSLLESVARQAAVY